MISNSSGKYNRIQELIELYEEYETSTGQTDNLGFASFLIAKQESPKQVSSPAQKILELCFNPIIKKSMPLRASLAMLIRRLYRYTLLYSKKALENTAINNLEDLNYLLSLRILETPSKTELINWNVSEFSSGIEVIKRLIKNGFIDELPSENDKRSKKLKITDKGSLAIAATMEHLPHLATIAFGQLSDEQVKTITEALYPLEKWHWDNLTTAKDLNWKELLSHLEIIEEGNPV